MRRVLLLIACLLPLTGCAGLGATSEKAIAYLPVNDAQPGRGTEFAFFVSGEPGASLPVRVDGLPPGWSFQPDFPTIKIPGDAGSTTLLARITPALDAPHAPQALTVLVGNARAPITVNVRPLGDQPARAGIGVVLRYVLFLDNGSLVESDDPAAFERGIPNATIAGSEHSTDPLNVYVGGQRGTRPPEPYNSTNCQQGDSGPCYHPVIVGFNERIENAGDGAGMLAGETLAVRVPKEKAYHTPGNEASPVYDLNLNFLIRIERVDVLAAKSCALPVCA